MPDWKYEEQILKDSYKGYKLEARLAQLENSRLRELLMRSKDYLDEWFTWLEENTAKDIDDLMELALEIAKELGE